MIAYLIPLKSKRVSNDWVKTCDLLKNTVQSILNQSCQDFTICIICHEEPEIDGLKENDKIFLFKSPFDLLLKDGKTKIDSYLDIDRILDKLQKTHIGLYEMKKYNPYYYMVLDADDYLHKDFTDYVMKTKDENGYLVKKGYEYYAGINRVVKTERLEKVCGSTTVVSPKHLEIPPVDAYNSFIPILWNKFSHSDMEAHFQNIGAPLKEIPFYSVLYTLDHGQNDSDVFRKSLKYRLKKYIKLYVLGRAVSAKLKSNFSLE